jgi:hypothetical protein
MKEYDILGDYGSGWELVTCEETRTEALRALGEYRENEPGVPFTYKKVKRND